MKISSYVCSTLLAAVFAGPALAADAPAAAASGPSARQLAALCDNCVLVTATRVDTRKGKGSGAGAVGGAVVGGVVGNKVGDGGTVSTGVGAVAGGLLGHEIEKRLKKNKVWVTTVVGRDGRPQHFEAATDPGVKVGDALRVEKGQLVKPSIARKKPAGAVAG
jgi:outer membrane lipoprotein SlyB